MTNNEKYAQSIKLYVDVINYYETLKAKGGLSRDGETYLKNLYTAYETYFQISNRIKPIIITEEEYNLCVLGKNILT